MIAILRMNGVAVGSLMAIVMILKRKRREDWRRHGGGRIDEDERIH